MSIWEDESEVEVVKMVIPYLMRIILLAVVVTFGTVIGVNAIDNVKNVMMR